MLAGGLNQRIRENSYFFTIIYFTGSGGEGEGFGQGSFNHWELGMGHGAWGMGHGALGMGHWAWGIGEWQLLTTVNSQQSTAN